MEKIAILLNGDSETRHLDNIDDAVKALRAAGPYQIFVASPQAPKEKVDVYVAPTQKNWGEIISAVRNKIGPQDQLVVYLTGHGNEGKKGLGCIELSDGCLGLEAIAAGLKQLTYAQGIVIMDHCHSGESLAVFAKENTTVVTQGSPGEMVSCQNFSPYFWGDAVTDFDRDGKISIQERYQFALEQGSNEAHSQFYGTEPMSFEGPVTTRPFATDKNLPITVHNGKELQDQIKRLRPGQRALVHFGADWCEPCKIYRPHFEKISHELAGSLLTIEAEGSKESEKDWNKYGVLGFPTVAFIDHLGRATIVKNIQDPLASLVDAATESTADLQGLIIMQLTDLNPKRRYMALSQLIDFEKLDSKYFSTLFDLASPSPPSIKFDSAAEAIRREAQGVVAWFALKDPSWKKKILEKLKTKDRKQVKTALEMMGVMSKIDADRWEGPSVFRPLLPRLTSFLENPDLELQHQALKVIHQTYANGSKGLPNLKSKLIPKLDSKHAGIREEAIVFLCLGYEHCPAETLSFWVNKLKDSKLSQGPRNPIETLFGPGQEAREILVAMAVLREKFGPRAKPAIPQLLKFLDHWDSDLRIAAAKTLYKIDPDIEAKAVLPAVWDLPDGSGYAMAMREISIQEMGRRFEIHEKKPFLRWLPRLHLGAEALTLGEEFGVGTQGGFGMRKGAWELGGNFLYGRLLSRSSEEQNYFRGDLEAKYHYFLPQEPWDIYYQLPSLGVGRTQLENQVRTLLSSSAGGGIQYSPNFNLAFDLSGRVRVDSDLKDKFLFGFEAYFGTKYQWGL